MINDFKSAPFVLREVEGLREGFQQPAREPSVRPWRSCCAMLP